MRARLERRLGRTPEIRRHADPPGDVFHATNHVFPFRIRRARTVLTIHDLTLLLFPQWHPAARRALMSPLLAESVERADRIVAPSIHTRNDILKSLPVEPERVVVIPEGVDPIFGPKPAVEAAARLTPLGLRAGHYLLFLGTIEPRKNLGRLLRAMETTDPDVGPLVVAGGQAGTTGPSARPSAAWRATHACTISVTCRTICGRRCRPVRARSFIRPATKASACRRWKRWRAGPR